MRLDKYISRSRVVDLGSADLEGALVELLNLTVERFPDLNKDSLLKGLLRRVIGKIFNDTEIKGWCKEFEAKNLLNVTGTEASLETAEPRVTATV